MAPLRTTLENDIDPPDWEGLNRSKVCGNECLNPCTIVRYSMMNTSWTWHYVLMCIYLFQF